MERWRVKSFRRTATWFHACEVDFLDAEDAHAAKLIVESRSTPEAEIRVWAVTPATEAMEQHYLDWLRRCAEWRRLAAQAAAPRALLSKGPGA